VTDAISAPSVARTERGVWSVGVARDVISYVLARSRGRW